MRYNITKKMHLQCQSYYVLSVLKAPKGVFIFFGKVMEFQLTYIIFFLTFI